MRVSEKTQEPKTSITHWKYTQGINKIDLNQEKNENISAPKYKSFLWIRGKLKANDTFSPKTQDFGLKGQYVNSFKCSALWQKFKGSTSPETQLVQKHVSNL